MRLKEAQKILHHEAGKKGRVRKARLTRTQSSMQKDFDHIPYKPPTSRYLLFFSIFSFIFFLVAIALAFLIDQSGTDNQYSPNKILLVTDGPTTVDSASSVAFTVRVANRNPIPLKRARLIVQYPEGVYTLTPDGTPTQQQEFEIGLLDVGATKTLQITPAVHGLANESKEIRYVLEYRAGDALQSFTTERGYVFGIRNAAVAISPIEHTTPVSGKEISFAFDVQANGWENVRDLSVVFQHPAGFTPNNPVNSNETHTVWKIPLLERTKKRSFTLSGVINTEGAFEQSAVVRTFIASGEAEEEQILVAENNVTLQVGSSFIAAKLTLSGQSGTTFVAQPSQTVQGRLSWQNIDQEQLEDIVFYLDFSGTGLDEGSIKSRYGFFDEIRKRLVWSGQELDALDLVPADGEMDFSFEFATVPNRPEFNQENKIINLAVSAEAYRVSESRVDKVKNIAVADVAVASVLQVSGNTLYSTSELENEGPIPPTVGVPTTYTLRYTFKNSGNDLSDIALTIPLSRDVKFFNRYTGGVGSNVQYNEDDHEIVVTLDTLEAYGFGSVWSIEIQVLLEPTAKLVGKEPTLADRATYRARDTHVDLTFEGRLPQLRTRMYAEPHRSEHGVVVEGAQ